MVFILELTPFDGEFASISVNTDSFSEAGESCCFCIATIDNDGVLRIVDYGYPSLLDARNAWPEALGSIDVPALRGATNR